MGQANSLVVVGDTDHWSMSVRDPRMGVDATLRFVQRFETSAGQGIIGGNAGLPRTAFIVPRYVEMEVSSDGATGLVLAVADASYDIVSLSNIATGGAAAFTFAATRSGDITNVGATVQSGLPAMLGRLVMGLRLRLDGANLRGQFYMDGALWGSEYILSATPEAWRLAVGFGAALNSVFLRADADDQRYRPSDCQPWGAAARVAAVGGYSPSASKLQFDEVNTPVYLGRTTTSSVNDASVQADRSPATGLRYVEFAIEVAASSAITMACGLVVDGFDKSSQIGSEDLSWGYRANGTRYHDGISNVVPFTYTAGDYVGVIWNSATGHMWLAKNGVVLSGDPEAGSGAYYTNVQATFLATRILPGITPGTAGRVRLATHAREQRYRPPYCQAWDGGDALPEQHYRGRLARNVEVTTGIWFPFPWGGSRGGSPIGAVEVENTDGQYDHVSQWELRDQSMSVYELDANGGLTNEARAVCDSVELSGQSSLRVLARGVDALLDRRVDQPIVAAGAVGCVPAVPVENESISYNVSASPLNVSIPFPLSDLLVYDQGLLVTSHRRGDADKVRGFVRTVNPAGKQSLRNLVIARRGLDYPLANAGFDAWSGDNPTSWTVVETAPNALITQSGAACRFVRNAGAPEASIRQSLGFNALGGGRVFVDVQVSARTSGSLTARIWTALGVPVTKALNITSTGRWIGYLPWSVGPNSTAFIQLQADDSTDLSVDSVEVYRADNAYGLDNLVRYVLEELGGLGASRWAWASNSSPAGSPFAGGVWSDRQPTVRELLGLVLDSVLCSYYTDAEGRLMLAKLDIFDFIDATPVSAALAERDVIGHVAVKDDLAPSLSDSLLWSINHAQHSEAELAGGVGAADRAYLSSTGYVRNIADGLPLAYHPFYSHALGAPPRPTAWSQITSKASTEADMDLTVMQALERSYVARRRFYEATIKASSVRGVQPGSKVSLTHSRFGLSAGKDLMLVRSRRPLGAATTKVTLWG